MTRNQNVFYEYKRVWKNQAIQNQSEKEKRDVSAQRKASKNCIPLQTEERLHEQEKQGMGTVNNRNNRLETKNFEERRLRHNSSTE